jgi:hypothetical protein
VVSAVATVYTIGSGVWRIQSAVMRIPSSDWVFAAVFLQMVECGNVLLSIMVWM